MESNDESLPVATLHRIGTAEKYKCFKLRKEEVRDHNLFRAKVNERNYYFET